MSRLFFASLIVSAALLWLFYTKFFGAEYYPTGKRKIERMIKLAKIRKKDVVYDLGCGDGRIVLESAKYCKKAIGIEVDPIRFAIAWLRAKLSRQKNLKIIFGNFFAHSLKDASVILVFLTGHGNRKLEKNFKRLGIKKGTRIVSHHWKFAKMKPAKEDKKFDIYLYITK